MQPRVARTVHLAHPTRADRVNNLVRAQESSWREMQWCRREAGARECSSRGRPTLEKVACLIVCRKQRFDLLTHRRIVRARIV